MLGNDSEKSASETTPLYEPIPVPMFDWPEQTQTSPTNTSVSSMLLPSPFADTLSVRDSVDAGKESSVSFHAPFSSTFIVLCCPAKSTVTSSPALAQPQTRTGISCCNTMCDPKTDGNRSAAIASEYRD